MIYISAGKLMKSSTMARFIVAIAILLVYDSNEFVIERLSVADRMNVDDEVCRDIGGYKVRELCFCRKKGTLLVDFKDTRRYSCDTKNNYTFDNTMHLKHKANISYIHSTLAPWQSNIYDIAFLSDRKRVTTTSCKHLTLIKVYKIESRKWTVVGHSKNIKLESENDNYYLVIPISLHTEIQGSLLYVLLSDSNELKLICKGRLLLRFSGKINFTFDEFPTTSTCLGCKSNAIATARTTFINITVQDQYTAIGVQNKTGCSHYTETGKPNPSLTLLLKHLSMEIPNIT